MIDPVNKNPVSAESGGLSGKPLFNLSTNILREMYVLTRVCCLLLQKKKSDRLLELLAFSWAYLLCLNVFSI